MNAAAASAGRLSRRARPRDSVAAEDRLDPHTGSWRTGIPGDAAGIRGWQLGRAWELVEEVSRSNPFYREHLGPLPADRSATAFRALPVTRKDDVVADCTGTPPFGRRTTLPAADVRHVVETSGTSGRGREIYPLCAADEKDVFRAAAVGFSWAGVRPGTTVLLTLPVAMAAAGIWYYGALRLLGANVLSAGSYSTERKVEAIRRYAPAVVVGTPSYLGRLAAFARAAGLDPAAAGVEAIVVAGEPYGIAWAQEAERTWGAALFEQYGSTERTMAWACPRGAAPEGHRGTLHFPPELSYWEVVDPETGDEVPPGGRGELVCTPLGTAGSPLIRFATGDRVELVGPGECPCTRPLGGVRAGSVERYDDMMKIRGVNVWPATFDDAILGIDEVADYRGTVTRGPDGSERVAVRIECLAEAGQTVSRAVRRSIRAITGLNVDVEVVGAGTLGRDVPEGFVKVSRWEDHRGGALR